MNSTVEALLLLDDVEARRPGGLLLEGEVHALETAVLRALEAPPATFVLVIIRLALGGHGPHSLLDRRELPNIGSPPLPMTVLKFRNGRLLYGFVCGTVCSDFKIALIAEINVGQNS